MKTLSKVELNEKAVLLWIAENETLTPKQCLVSYMKSALGLINGRYYILCSDNAKKKLTSVVELLSFSRLMKICLLGLESTVINTFAALKVTIVDGR